jgi:uncharacterized protein YcfJ
LSPIWAQRARRVPCRSATTGGEGPDINPSFSGPPAGFDVLYEFEGHQHHVHMNKEPGGALPVKDGKVVLA